ncbi:beta-amyrin 28-monooxygenase-like [Coffea eugenioides]|uniref:beta-amyrin 28-monooxygenase-like n=1 Tax=Coffea eugenioides TaxID=49369 RepID=UPI000F611A4A|nr:beta-amyrin 28-monooxygenase-like [Coffea eugenioides]
MAINNDVLPSSSFSSSFFIFASSSAFTALVLLLLLLFLYNNKVVKPRRRDVKSRLKLPPGSYGWPIVGETAEFFRRCMEGAPETFINDRVERYQCDRVFKTSLFGERVAILCGASGNKFLFSNENKLVHVWWPASVRRLLGPCLATSVGDEAKMMRKMLSYFVNPDAFMRLYSNTIDSVTRQHITTHWQGKEEVTVFPAAKLYLFELACRLFLSLEEPQRIAKLAADFNIFLKGLVSNPIKFPGTRFYKALRATAAIKKQLVTLVRQRKVALQMGRASPSQDLLSHLLVTPNQNGAFMSEAMIVNNILMLLFAGHDTSAAAITSLVKALGEHPQVYHKVFQEQSEIASSKVGAAGDDELLQWEDIQKMKYSWNVVSEVMRLTPSGIGIFREALTDLKYEGYDIPKGWKLYWSASFTHRDANLFPEPTKFDPSRFDEGGDHTLIPFSYVSFGGGPRMCIGKEFAKIVILTFLHHLVNRFRWDLVIPDEKVEYDPTPIPVKGLPVCVFPHIPSAP